MIVYMFVSLRITQTNYHCNVKMVIPEMLKHVWAEISYCVHVCHSTKGVLLEMY
jgi:hypothetical protein